MIQQINSLAPASFFRLEEMSSFEKKMLSLKISALRKGIIFPDKLISELNNFILRNSLSEGGFNVHCPDCLKAYASKILDEMMIQSDAKEFILSALEGNLGHGGYYLDEEKLFRI